MKSRPTVSSSKPATAEVRSPYPAAMCVFLHLKKKPARFRYTYGSISIPTRKRCIDTNKGPIQTSEEGADLRDFVVDLWATGSLSSRDFAVLSHLTSRAGGQGLADLAMPPDDKGMKAESITIESEDPWQEP